MRAWVHLSKPCSDDADQQKNARDPEQDKQELREGVKLLGLDQMFQFNKRPLQYIALFLNLS